MAKNDFIKALWPLWATEIFLSGLYHAFGPQEATVLSTILMLISVAVLPFIAGHRVVRFGGSNPLAVLGAISISAASILVVAISYLVVSAGIMAFFGFIVASLMFSVAPQAVFGGVGAFVAKKFSEKTT